MTPPPFWLVTGAKVRRGARWYFVAVIDEHGLVLETRIPGYLPMRRLLNPAELAHDLETGELRPFHDPLATGELNATVRK
jgi:hypothetical protein